MDNYSNIKESSIKAIKWSALAEISSKIFPPIVMIILARILDPSVFGVVSIAIIISSLAVLIQNFGLGKAIIQTEHHVEIYSNNAFWISLIISIVLYAIVYMLAPVIAIFFKSPESFNVIRVMCLQVVFSSVIVVQVALLQRKMNFKKIFFIRFISSVVPGLVSIPMAFYGMGAWSLVFGALAASVTQAIMYWTMFDWKPRFQFDFAMAKKMLLFSKWIFMEGLLAWIINWGDSIALGFYLGVKDLGVYRIGVTIVNLVSYVVLSHIIPVAYSLLSRFQSDRVEFKKIFLKLNKVINVLTIPIGLGLILLAKPIIIIFFGDKWMGLEIVVILLVARWVLGWTVGLFSSVYAAINRPELNVKLLLISTVLSVLVYIFSAKYGLFVFCLARTLVLVPEIIINVLVFTNVLEIRKNLLFSSVFPALPSALVMSLFVIALGRVFSLGSIFSISITIILAAFMYVISIWFINRDFFIWAKQNVFKLI